MKLPKMIEGNFEPHFALKHMLKDMLIAGRLGLSHHLELAVTTAARDRLLEQEQRGYAEEDFSVIARKYFPEMVFPTVEQDRKSTRLNSSHRCISYAVFCLKKKMTADDMSAIE